MAVKDYLFNRVLIRNDAPEPYARAGCRPLRDPRRGRTWRSTGDRALEKDPRRGRRAGAGPVLHTLRRRIGGLSCLRRRPGSIAHAGQEASSRTGAQRMSSIMPIISETCIVPQLETIRRRAGQTLATDVEHQAHEARLCLRASVPMPDGGEARRTGRSRLWLAWKVHSLLNTGDVFGRGETLQSHPGPSRASSSSRVP
jgi:hypothetical protein